jgi:hypothetical protein
LKILLISSELNIDLEGHLKTLGGVRPHWLVVRLKGPLANARKLRESVVAPDSPGSKMEALR